MKDIEAKLIGIAKRPSRKPLALGMDRWDESMDRYLQEGLAQGEGCCIQKPFAWWSELVQTGPEPGDEGEELWAVCRSCYQGMLVDGLLRRCERCGRFAGKVDIEDVGSVFVVNGYTDPCWIHADDEKCGAPLSAVFP